MEQPSRRDSRTSEHYERVREFMQKAGQPTPKELTQLDEATRLLRAHLILEEAFEIIDKGLKIDVFPLYEEVSIDGPDHLGLVPRAVPINLEEIADGCADLRVVTTGTLIACGIEDEELQRVVDESNLKKFEVPKCPDCEHTMYIHYPLDGTEDGNIGRWACIKGVTKHTQLPIEAGPHRRSDGKHIKPPYWKKPDIAGVIGLEKTYKAPGGDVTVTQRVAKQDGTGRIEGI